MRHLYHHGRITAPPDPDGDGYLHQTNRDPTATQSAWVTARDRVCVAPGCRRPARRCEVDHSLAWVKGGETVHCNLGLLCRRHHVFKHATGSELIQSVPGLFWWRTPAGMQYTTRPEPPLLLDANQLAGLPKPSNPDARLVPADHTFEQWDLPSALGADPNLLYPDDILLPEDIDELDNQPVPGG